MSILTAALTAARTEARTDVGTEVGAPCVTDDHVVVPASVMDPVVVTFDGQYVWSFSPDRDGVRSRGGWQVAWPEALRTELVGTARVRLADTLDERVHFEGEIAFRAPS